MPLFASKKIRILTGLLLGFGLVTIGFYLTYPKKSPYFRPTKGEMIHPRTEHQSILLKDGRVLIVGGYLTSKTSSSQRQPVLQAEIYNPETETFSPAGQMKFLHQGGTLTLLQDGRVLLAGGAANLSHSCQNGLKTTEIFNPLANKFLWTGQLITPRTNHAATLLPDGKVLITAGQAYICTEKDTVHSDKGSFLKSQEIFDPKVGKFSQSPSLLEARIDPQVIRYSSNEILVTGQVFRGFKVSSFPITKQDNNLKEEIYNFSTKQRRYVSLQPQGGLLYSIPPDKVLKIRGQGHGNRAKIQFSLLNKHSLHFDSQFLSKNSVSGYSPELALLPGQRLFMLLVFSPGVLDFPPSSQAFIYDVKANQLINLGEYPGERVLDVSTVTLKTGSVLSTGGQCRNNCPENSPSAWLYDPQITKRK